MTEHESRLNQELLTILQSQTLAALGTLDTDGSPNVSMVPFAIEPESGCVVLHVSGVAPHTAHMRADSRVSMLVIAPGEAGTANSAAPRVTLNAMARFIEAGSAVAERCRNAYFSRFPQHHELDAMLDYSFVSLSPRQARHVSGYGAMRSMSESNLLPLLAAAA